MADTPAAAPSAAPQSEAAEAAERDALIAELDSAEGPDLSESEPAEQGGKEVPGEAEPSENTDKDDGDDDTNEEVDEEVEQTAFDSADEFRDHVKGLIDAGELRKVEEALGLEKNALKINGAKLRYVRESLAKAQKATSKAEVEATNARQLIESAKAYYGPMVEAKQLFAEGTPQGVQKAARFVERHFGVPLTQFVESVLKAGRGEALAPRGPDPEVAELKQTVQRLLEERNQQQTQAQAQAAEARHLDAIKAKLGSTPLAKLGAEGARVVYDKIRGSYDQGLGAYKLNLRDAIVEAQKDPAVKWRLHELAQKAAKRAPAPPAAPVRRRVVAAPKDESLAAREAREKQQLIAELESEMVKLERASRRSNARG